MPPNDVAGMEAFKWSLEKCHYNPYAMKMHIGGWKVPNDIYSWMRDTEKGYFDFSCLMGKNKQRVRKFLIPFFKSNPRINHKTKKNIIKQLNSDQPFWFPYRELPDIQIHLNKLNKVYFKKWKSMMRKYSKLNEDDKCEYCYNKNWKLKYCKGCKNVRYCSRKCQKKHWIKHKTHCCI